MNPMLEAQKSREHNYLRDQADSSAAPGAASAQQNTPEDSNLAAVVTAWPTLPEAVRAGIVAMVQVASRG